MLTKFSEFFELRANADDIHKRLFKAIENTENIVDCYKAVFEYIIEGLKWRSLKARHDEIEDAVDLTDLANHTSQIEDIEKFPEEDEWLLQLQEQVLFEKLEIKQFTIDTRIQTNQYIFNVNENPAYKQVKFYLQLEIYNQHAQKMMPVVGNPPPPDPITIDPKTAVPNPTQPSQVKELQDRTDKLIDWIKQNTPKLKTILAVQTGKNNKGLFDLVFGIASPLDFSERLQAIETMLEKLKSNKNTPLVPFGTHLTTELKNQNVFWNKDIGGNQFNKITDLKEGFTQNLEKNKRIYDHFQNLFANFLSEELYPGEDATAVATRQQTALSNIKGIFESFTNPKVQTSYDDTMNEALKTIQGKYVQEYTSKLEEAKTPLPDPPTILPMAYVMAIKRQADNFLGTLPLKLKNGSKQDVTLLLVTTYKEINPGEVSHPRLTMEIGADPKENTISFYRPVFDSHRIADNSTDQRIKFCNLQDQKGTFLYLVDTEPTIVKIKGKTGADKKSEGELTIDFGANTLTYLGKTKKPIENDTGELYVQEGKKGKFFDDVKARTKWTTLLGNRRYDPYYQTNPATPNAPIPHLMGHLGSGRGLSRALPVEEDLYLWQWNYTGADKDDYKKLAGIFKLSPERQIILDPTKSSLITINTQQYAYSENTFPSSANSFFYKIISIKPAGKGDNELEFYVQVNTPKPNIASELKLFPVNRSITPRPFEPSPEEVLTIFDFSYYRRVTPVVAADGTRSFDPDKSKIIQRFTPDDPRKPTGAIPLPDWSTSEKKALGLNLPICFNLPKNIQWYHTDKQQREKLINKGNPLYREKKMRLNAATAMQPLYNNLKSAVQANLSKSSGLPATAFSKQAIQSSNKVKDDWQKLKKDAKNYFPVNQEWCHLMGHGDGGNEYLGNFVSGSYHCNTEQLAIETGQRNITQQAKMGDYVLHTTAYLLHDQDLLKVSEIIVTPYLTKEQEYTNLVSATLKRHQTKLASITTSSVPTTTTTTTTSTATTTSTTTSTSTTTTTTTSTATTTGTTTTTSTTTTSDTKKRPADDGSGQPSKKPAIEYGKSAPVAAYIRYKVMKAEGGELKKHFDYIFEGQSEFIDEHQFQIISRAVQFALAGKTELKNWIDSEK